MNFISFFPGISIFIFYNHSQHVATTVNVSFKIRSITVNANVWFSKIIIFTLFSSILFIFMFQFKLYNSHGIILQSETVNVINDCRNSTSTDRVSELLDYKRKKKSKDSSKAKKKKICRPFRNSQLKKQFICIVILHRWLRKTLQNKVQHDSAMSSLNETNNRIFVSAIKCNIHVLFVNFY